ncbi:DNA replication protein [Ancylobacter dichloromethanicus]|uniref:DUF6456 domain-containing protein n=1 Tax=Ancylobacter dichloromethanicus TaxID=518825 RepID=A0A9W6N1K0_9HYPH|nr:DUF6456 domain-containing protein [Ancylobacter dichloromethanicus]MBS7552503.1 DNA replication protein [Ancylobacter dichloromethanicus]GLK74245.1 hypothetical protein GCM10017643_43630 [Ancylobacter dichloromethanicus]
MVERRIDHVEVEIDGVRCAVAVDLEESPLGWLARRRGRDGSRFIAPVQLIAGERLRADFTRAGMAPRLTANWDAVTRTDQRGAAPGLNASEASFAARQRVSRAMEAAGPEFSGLLMDVCCFLKGLEQVEQERGWPARTAKVVLALGLDRLARHYGLSEAAQGPSRARTRAWRAAVTGGAGEGL